MSYNKISAKGVVIKFGTAATPTGVVKGLDTIGLKTGKRDLVETTAHDSDTTRSYADAGLRDSNEITFDFFYDPSDTVHESIRAAHAGGAAANTGNPYYLTFLLPNSTTSSWAASGFVTDFDVANLGTKNPLKASCTFKAIAKETFTQ
jgi:hypothetical protein